MKISVKVLSAILLLLIILPVSISLLLAIPSVQNYAVDLAADFASKKIGTRVSIDHITVGLLNKVRVRGFYVEDLDRDTLIYAGSVTAYVGGLSNIADRLVLNVGRVEDGKFILRETERGTMNVKEIVDRISKKRNGRFKMLIRSLDAVNIDFRMERLVHRNPEFGVDYADMYLRGITGHIDDFTIEGGAVGGDITSMTFTERCGFRADDISGSFLVDRGLIALSPLNIEAGNSKIFMPELTLTGDGWGAYKDFIRNVRIDASVSDSYADTEDVGCFAPSIRAWHTSVADATFSMHGTVADFNAKIDNVRLEDGGTLRAEATVRGLTDVPRTRFDIKVRSLDASTDEIVRLLKNIARLDVPQPAAKYVDRTERLSLSGAFRGTVKSFAANASVALGCGGRIDLSGKMSPDDVGRSIAAEIEGRSVPLDRIVGSRMLGDVSFAAGVSATTDGGLRSVEGEGTISGLRLNGHDYTGISFDGRMNDGRLRASLRTEDPALESDAVAVIGFGGAEPTYDAVINIGKADLFAMNVNRRDTVSVLSASIGLSAHGDSLDTMNGELSIADASYRQGETVIDSDIVSVTVESNEDTRTVKLTSDFADAVFECRSRYGDVAYYLKNLLNRYVPAMYDESDRRTIERRSEDLRRNIALLSVTTKRLDPLLGCITGEDGLEVSEGTLVQVFMNPVNNRFVMRGKSDFVAKDRYMATELKLNVDNRDDSLAMRLSAADLYVGTLHLSNVGVDGGAKDNGVNVSGSFADTVRNVKGRLAAASVISRHDGMRRIAVRLLPSFVSRGDEVWNISSDGIDIDSSRIAVRRFFVRSADQELYMNGVASRSANDSLVMKLRNFELSPFTQVANRLGYEIGGRTTGFAKVKSALRDSEIDAHILLDSVDVNGMRIPNLLLSSSWDLRRSRASLTVATQERRDTLVRGFFAPSKMRYYARLKIDSLRMGLLDPMLKGVVSQTKGTAHVDLVLNGERRTADLSGGISVRDLSTMVDYTKCVYRVPSADIRVKNNRFVVSDAPVYDAGNNRGSLDMNLSLDHLSNVEYEFGMKIREMQVLNTTRQDNDMFYGSVYASGNALIKGDKSGVLMDIVAATDGESEFFMPLSGQSNISNADFVIFESADKPDTTDYLVRKKLMFERRQKRHSSTRGAMDITMALDVRKNAEVQLVIDPTVGDIIRGRGDGSLNLRINPRKNIFEMYGDYTIDEGSYLFTLQNIVNKRFVIESGSTIQWTGEPLDAMLNIDAVYKLKASLQPLLEGSVAQSNISSRGVPVECVIHLTDRLTHPTVTFDVIVPNVDSDVQSVIANALSTPESRSQQFLYLLVAGSFVSEAINNNASSSIGESTAATTGFELLSNQLSNWLSTEDYNIVIRYRPKTEVTGDEVDIGFSKGLINNRLLIEVEGNYIADKSQVVNASSNFAGEAYVTWLIDKAGTLRLKGFTHTIDRFDENQGLQETGIGIYYKEDFDNFEDLRRRVAARFGSKKRRARKTAEAEKRNAEAVKEEKPANGEKSAGETPPARRP